MKNYGRIFTLIHKYILLYLCSVNSENQNFSGESLAAEAGSGDNFELLPPKIREQTIRMSAENKRLKEQIERDVENHQQSKIELNDTIQNLLKEKADLQNTIAQLEQVDSKYTF